MVTERLAMAKESEGRNTSGFEGREKRLRTQELGQQGTDPPGMLPARNADTWHFSQ